MKLSDEEIESVLKRIRDYTLAFGNIHPSDDAPTEQIVSYLLNAGDGRSASHRLATDYFVFLLQAIRQLKDERDLIDKRFLELVVYATGHGMRTGYEMQTYFSEIDEHVNKLVDEATKDLKEERDRLAALNKRLRTTIKVCFDFAEQASPTAQNKIMAICEQALGEDDA